MLLIVSGPSGVGKSRLIEVAIKSFGFGRAVPVTSRDKREGEEHGVDYEFVSKGQFRDLIRRNQLCAWDYTLRNYYGYKRDLQPRLQRGEDVVIHALARMSLRMSQTLPDTLLLFLSPSSNELLESRLVGRKYDQEEMRIRRTHWEEESEHSSLFNWVLRDGDRTPTESIADLLAEIVTRFR